MAKLFATANGQIVAAHEGLKKGGQFEGIDIAGIRPEQIADVADGAVFVPENM